MDSLWLSLSEDNSDPDVRVAARTYLEGRLAPELVSDTLTVIAALTRRVSGGGAELIVSRRDNIVLVELLSAPPRPAGDPPQGLTRAWTFGAHSTGIRGVLWAQAADQGAVQPTGT